MKKYLLNTNILLRFLLADHAELSPKATRLFQRAAERECLLILTDLGIAEAVWVLTSDYNLKRTAVAESLAKMLVRAGVHCPDLDRSLTPSTVFLLPIAIFTIAIWRRKRSRPVWG